MPSGAITRHNSTLRGSRSTKIPYGFAITKLPEVGKHKADKAEQMVRPPVNLSTYLVIADNGQHAAAIYKTTAGDEGVVRRCPD